MVDLVTLAIPVFLISIALEAWIGRRRGIEVMRGPDVVANLSLGSMQTLLGLVAGGALVFLYELLYETSRWFTISEKSIVAWAAIVIGVDFFYYWFHRCGHRVNLAWATHAPHHSSEDFNLAVALRQGPLQPLVSRFFYLPLALVGFPLSMTLLSLSLNTVLQFFVHTELVKKLGPLEWILNTPSHHRVHHGCNGSYLDKNYAGIFIVWDRLFGTFEAERERPIYGTVKQLGTWNPIAATWRPFADIIALAQRSTTHLDLVRAWWKPPEWRPKGIDAPSINLVTRARYDIRPSVTRGRYVTAMFVVTLLVLVALLLFGAAHLSSGRVSLCAAWLVLSFASLGALLDGKDFAPRLELARWVAVLPVVFVLLFD